MANNRLPDDQNKEEKLRKLAEKLATNPKLQRLDESNPSGSAADNDNDANVNDLLSPAASFNVSGATSRSGDDDNDPFSNIRSPASGGHREVSQAEDEVVIPTIQVAKDPHWDVDAPPTPEDSESAEVSRSPSQAVSPRYRKQVQSPIPSSNLESGAASVMSPKASQLLQVPVASSRVSSQADRNKPAGVSVSSADLKSRSKVASFRVTEVSQLASLDISAASAATPNVNNENQSGSNLPVGAAAAAVVRVNVQPTATPSGTQTTDHKHSTATRAPARVANKNYLILEFP